jgi:hypothetical protein
MRPSFDFNSLNAFDATINTAMIRLDNKQIAQVLALSVIPVERAMRQYTLVHKSSQYRLSSKFRPGIAKKQASRYNTNRLYESMRTRNVTTSSTGARVIVGASKKARQAGWRAHFIDRGFTTRNGRRIAGKHFSEQAVRNSESQVNALFGAGMSIQFRKVFNG